MGRVHVERFSCDKCSLYSDVEDTATRPPDGWSYLSYRPNPLSGKVDTLYLCARCTSKAFEALKP